MSLNGRITSGLCDFTDFPTFLLDEVALEISLGSGMSFSNDLDLDLYSGAISSLLTFRDIILFLRSSLSR